MAGAYSYGPRETRYAALMRRIMLVTLALSTPSLLSACHKDTPSGTASSASASTNTAAGQPSGAASTHTDGTEAVGENVASPASFGLPEPPQLAPGPIRVKGYPDNVRNGMNDPADWAGFTKDGAEFGYCATVGAKDPVTEICNTVDRKSKLVTRTSENRAQQHDNKLAEDLKKWRDASGLTELKPASPTVQKPPALAGNWPFTDIVVEVLVAGSTATKKGDMTPAVVKLGGAVGDEAPVHPFTLGSNPKPQAPPHFAVLNFFALSPGGKELGAVGHFNACEYCDSFDVKRWTVGSFAAGIYNDTGFRHHGKKEYAKAAEYFLKAVFADPAAKLPAYNLACAYARMKDPHTQSALKLAIARGGDATKKRAPKDADFELVKNEPWFVELTK